MQCLEDFDIPLKLSHTVVEIHGKERVTGVTLAQVDENRKPIPGTEEFYSCDTLLLSCGLIPENELSAKAGIELSKVTSGPVVNESLETSVKGIFACGNVLHVHDLVDYVSEEAKKAGQQAAAFLYGKELQEEENVIAICPEGGIRYTVPQKLRLENMEDSLIVRFRVGKVYENVYINVYLGDKRIVHKKKKKTAPGEMEQIVLKKSDLTQGLKFDKIIMKLEEV